jgi:hypothetical protein
VCNWKSSILQSKQIFGPEHEQASVQTLRVVGELAAVSPTENVNFSLLYGNGVDHMTAIPFVQEPQVLDGVSGLFTTERQTAENFQIVASSPTGVEFPKVIHVEIGAIAQGASR